MVFQSLVNFVRARGPDEFWRKRRIFKLSAVREIFLITFNININSRLKLLYSWCKFIHSITTVAEEIAIRLQLEECSVLLCTQQRPEN